MKSRQSNDQLRIGGHVSTKGGLLEVVKEAKRIGANTIQIFGASPVQWKAPLPDAKIAEEFKLKLKKEDIGPVFLHAPYLINLASPKGNMARISEALLERHLEIANFIGAFGVIFHIGSRGDRPQKESEELVANEISDIFSRIKEGKLLIENSAGAGNLVGDSLEEVGSIIKKVKDKRLGFCLDTAHAFESGIFSDYSKKGVDNFSQKMEKHIGLERFWVVHLNDSKTPAGSNKDRHENIGEGLIGSEGFLNLLSHKEFSKRPLILEVPGFSDNGPDKRNIEIVEKLANR
jgi:deoxyribonuclease-4